MATLGDIKIAIVGDARNFSHAIGTAKNDADTLGGRLRGMSGQAKAAFAGLAVGAVAFGKSSVSAFMEAEQAQSQLTAAYEKFPQLAGQNADALRSLNTELARKTKFDDDATASAQAVLAQFGLTQDQLLKVTPLLQDYAEKTGKDLPTAAQDIGKAILGQGRALKAVGIDFQDTGSAAGNFEQIMGGLTDKVGGFAEVAGSTSAGKVAILKNQFGELQEKIGGALVPVLGKLADILSSVMTWIEENQGTAQVLAVIVGGVLTAAFVAWGASVIAATWPIILIGAAIAALVAGVIYAYTHWDWFRNAVDAVARFLTQTLWPALQKVWAFIKDNLIPIIAAVIEKYVQFYKKVAEVAFWIVGAFAGVVDWFGRLPGTLGGIFGRLAEIITAPFRTAFDAIKRLWNNTIGGFGFEFGGWDPPGPGSVPGISFRIPRMARGGIVTGPTLAMIGEAGPEAVVPLSRGFGGSTTVVVQIGNTVIDELVIDSLGRVESRNGAVRLRTRVA